MSKETNPSLFSNSPKSLVRWNRKLKKFDLTIQIKFSTLSSIMHTTTYLKFPFSSFHLQLLHHFSFLSFLTSGASTLAPLRNRISTTSSCPLSAAQCKGVLKMIQKIYLVVSSLVNVNIQPVIKYVIFQRIHQSVWKSLPPKNHIFSFFYFCMNLMDLVSNNLYPLRSSTVSERIGEL